MSQVCKKVTNDLLRLKISTEEIRELDKQTSWNIKDETPVVPFERTEVSSHTPAQLTPCTGLPSTQLYIRWPCSLQQLMPEATG